MAVRRPLSSLKKSCCYSHLLAQCKLSRAFPRIRIAAMRAIVDVHIIGRFVFVFVNFSFQHLKLTHFYVYV